MASVMENCPLWWLQNICMKYFIKNVAAFKLMKFTEVLSPHLTFFFTLNTSLCLSKFTFPFLSASSPCSLFCVSPIFFQRAMRVRSHSMETMVGSHRHRSPGVGGGVPASMSGGLPQSTSECTKSTFTVSKLV